jgi:sulfotransferase
MTSPVASLFNAMLAATSRRNDTSVFINDEQRERLLRACFDSYYAGIHEKQVVFDTNRSWTTKLPALMRLFPSARMICCVRNPAWIIDSIESLVRRNPYQLSGMFQYRPNGTVYSRANVLLTPNGLYGFAWRGLREAVYGGYADRLLLVRYESLTSYPVDTLAAIYSFLAEAAFTHEPDRIEWLNTSREFDMGIGMPGLHDVGPVIAPRKRQTVLPPDLFTRLEHEAFWNNRRMMPAHVKVV